MSMKTFGSLTASTVVYFLFVFSGLIKALAGIDYFYVDITLFFAVICVAFVFLSVVTRKGEIVKKKHLFVILLLFVFFSWYAVAYSYSISRSYATVKIVASLTNLLAFIYPLFVRISFRLFAYLVLGVALIASGTSFYARTFLPWTEVTDGFRKLYLYAGFATGYSAIYIYFMNKVDSLGKESLMWVAIFTLLILGARGPLIFCIGLIFLGYLLSALIDKKSVSLTGRLRFLVLFFVIAGGFLTLVSSNELVSSQLERTLSRVELLFSEDKGGSVNTRVEHLYHAIEMISDKPIFGFGIGSFGMHNYGVDARAYPHNIILELWSEAGLIGLTLFLAFLLSCMLVSKNPLYGSILVVYGLLNALKSYGFEDLRVFFCFIAIAIAFERRVVGGKENPLTVRETVV